MVELAFKALNEAEGMIGVTHNGLHGEIRARFKRMPHELELAALARSLLDFPDVTLCIVWNMETGAVVQRVKKQGSEVQRKCDLCGQPFGDFVDRDVLFVEVEDWSVDWLCPACATDEQNPTKPPPLPPQAQ